MRLPREFALFPPPVPACRRETVVETRVGTTLCTSVAFHESSSGSRADGFPPVLDFFSRGFVACQDLSRAAGAKRFELSKSCDRFRRADGPRPLSQELSDPVEISAGVKGLPEGMRGQFFGVETLAAKRRKSPAAPLTPARDGIKANRDRGGGPEGRGNEPRRRNENAEGSQVKRAWRGKKSPEWIEALDGHLRGRSNTSRKASCGRDGRCT